MKNLLLFFILLCSHHAIIITALTPGGTLVASKTQVPTITPTPKPFTQSAARPTSSQFKPSSSQTRQELYQQAIQSPYDLALPQSQQTIIPQQKALNFQKQQTAAKPKTEDHTSSDIFDDSYFEGDLEYAGDNFLSSTVSSFTNWSSGTPKETSKVAPPSAKPAATKKISNETKQRILDDLQMPGLTDHASPITNALDLARAQRPIKPSQKSQEIKKSNELDTDTAGLFDYNPSDAEQIYDWTQENSWGGAADQKMLSHYTTPKEKLWQDVIATSSKNKASARVDTDLPKDEPKSVQVKSKPQDTYTLSTKTQSSEPEDLGDFEDFDTADDSTQDIKRLSLVPRPVSTPRPQSKDLNSEELQIIDEQAEQAVSFLSVAIDLVSIGGYFIAASVDTVMQQVLPKDSSPVTITPPAQASASSRASIRSIKKDETKAADTILENDLLQDQETAQATQAKIAAEKSFIASMKKTAQSIKDSPAKIKAFIKSMFEKLQIKLGMKKSEIPDEVIDQAADELQPLLQEPNSTGFGSGIMKWFTKKTELKEAQITYSKEQQDVVWQKTKQSEYIHGAQEVRFTYKDGKFSEITINYLGKDISFKHGDGFTGIQNPDGSFSIELKPSSYQALNRMKQDLTKSIFDKAGKALEKGVDALSSNVYNLGSVEQSINIGTAWAIQESTTTLESISIQFTPKHSISGSQLGVATTTQRPGFIQVTNTFKRAHEKYATQATFSANV